MLKRFILVKTSKYKLLPTRIKKFFELEAATAILLFLATACALIWVNSSYSDYYFAILGKQMPLTIDLLSIHKNLSLKDWINDALMAIFFFLIGLELKKEILVGELNSVKKISLPALAAFGGVIVPAIIFCAFNFNKPQNLTGFAIPTATDIAFAYGVICFFGKRIPHCLKVFIVTLAVLDDLMAIVIIAAFYSQDLSFVFLGLSLIPLVVLGLLNRYNSGNIVLYLLLGILLWLFVLKSGIHATLAGVLLAFFIPLKTHNQDFLKNLAHRISPWVNFLILPIFALANSGVKISNISVNDLCDSLTLGIICGLFFGKQIGVMLFSFVAVKMKIAELPKNLGARVSWSKFYSVVIFTAIGFTMSLFIGELSFVQNNTITDSVMIILDRVKIGILIASILSIFFGSLVTLYFNKQ